MKKILFFLLKGFLSLFVSVIFISSIHSQEILLEKDIDLQTYLLELNYESFPVVNSVNNEFALFLIDPSTINGLLFNDSFNLLDTMLITHSVKKSDKLLGYSFKDSIYTLYYRTGYLKIQSENINFAKKTCEIFNANIDIKNERYVESFSYKNQFYVLTIQEQSSLLHLYKLEMGKITDDTKFDFSDYIFSNDEKVSLYDLLKNYGQDRVEKIDVNNINPLEITSKPCKLYYSDENIFISLDKSHDKTILLSMNVSNKTTVAKSFTKNSICGDFSGTQSNSFLYMNNLYQIIACKSGIHLSITNIETGNTIKEFNATDSDEISFKNTPIESKSGLTLNNNEEFGDTRQFLKKISGLDIGISAYQRAKNIEITFGGYEYESSVTNIRGTETGNSNKTESDALISDLNNNPILNSYVSYRDENLTYCKGLFNNITFEHTKGEVKKNAFDKIEEFYTSNDLKKTADVIFSKDHSYITGYFLPKENKYILRKFEDD